MCHGFESFNSFRGCLPILASESMSGPNHLRDSTLALKGPPAEREAVLWPRRAEPEDSGTGMVTPVQYNKEELANDQSFLAGVSLPSLGIFKQRLAGCTWSWPMRRLNSCSCEHPFPPAPLHLRRTAAASHGCLPWPAQKPLCWPAEDSS